MKSKAIDTVERFLYKKSKEEIKALRRRFVVIVFVLIFALCILSGIMVNFSINEDKYMVANRREKMQIYSKEQNLEIDKQIKENMKIQLADTKEIAITNITEIEKSFNTIKIQVESSNSEGAKFVYFYKKQGDIEYKKAGESTENIFTYEKLEEREIYELRVRIEKDGKRVEKEIKVKTEKIPVNAIKFTNLTWNNSFASVTIEVTEKTYTAQYKIGESREWKRNRKWRSNK